ncbi:Uncharacterised protein [Mycobacteroides abscessus subsp. abscessus]|nr:Uncharacterised protein [Mycobacteroides abscessus subsp. abscessus]
MNEHPERRQEHHERCSGMFAGELLETSRGFGRHRHRKTPSGARGIRARGSGKLQLVRERSQCLAPIAEIGFR